MMFKNFREWQIEKSELLGETQLPAVDPSLLSNQIAKHEAMLKQAVERKTVAVAEYKKELGMKLRQALMEGDNAAEEQGMDESSPYMQWSLEVHELLDGQGMDRLEDDTYGDEE